MKNIFFVGFIFVGLLVTAQELDNKNLELDVPNEITELLEQEKKCVEAIEEPTVIEQPEFCNGVRLQAFYSKNRKDAEEKLKEIKKAYPTYHSNLFFVAPDYKVQLGFFKSRDDAQKLLIELRKKHSSAMIVNEKFRCVLIK